MRDEFRQSFALLPRCSDPRIWITKPSEGRVKKFICRRSASTAALSVEGPAKNELRRTILFSSHPPEPMVNERGLTDAGPSHDCNDVYILVCPCMIQEGDVLLSTKNIAACNGQSGYRDLLRCKSCWPLASSDTRSPRGRLLQALTSDSTPCIHRACYRQHRLQKFCGSLKSTLRVFFEENLQ